MFMRKYGLPYKDKFHASVFYIIVRTPDCFVAALLAIARSEETKQSRVSPDCFVPRNDVGHAAVMTMTRGRR